MLFLRLFLSIHPQCLVHPETWWPETSLTPVLLCLGLRLPEMFVITGSGGSLSTLKRLGKRRYKETPQPQSWRVSPQRHAIRSLCLLPTAMERVSHWLERKPPIVSFTDLFPYPSLLSIFRFIHLLLFFSFLFFQCFPFFLFSFFEFLNVSCCYRESAKLSLILLEIQ